MIKNMKKLLALVLAFIMLFGFCVVAFANASVERSTSVPTVYVQGYGAWIRADANDKNSEVIVGGEVPFLRDGVLGGMIDNIMTPLMNGITTGDYTEYNDLVAGTLVEELGRFGLDENGEPSDGSGNYADRDNWVTKRNWYGGKYDLYAYSLIYDWRVDPFVTAAELDAYIQKVKAATGSEKVNLVGRCLGGNIVLAYLSEYGYDDINSVNFYVTGMDGFELVGALFSGRVVVDSDALNNFLQSSLVEDDDGLISFAKSFLSILNFIKGLNVPIDVIFSIYEQVYTEIIPRVLIESFGSMPAFWSMVGPEYYEDAMALNFPDEEAQTKYAKLIEKIERYHNEVSLRTEEIITDAVDAGVKVYYTAKYGSPNIPLSEEASYHGDSTVTVSSQTLGATSVLVGDTFSSKYLKNAEKNGTAKYISPDKCIDASTAILPDHTWFIKGSSHANMPICIDILMANVFEASGIGESSHYVTVDDLADYPQYMLVESDDIDAPIYILTEENADVGTFWDVNIFDDLSNFLSRLLNFLSQLLNQIMYYIYNTEI